jgi:hypothetical protein
MGASAGRRAHPVGALPTLRAGKHYIFNTGVDCEVRPELRE